MVSAWTCDSLSWFQSTIVRSDIPGTDTQCVTIVGFVVKTRSNNLLSLVELLWTCISCALSVTSIMDC